MRQIVQIEIPSADDAAQIAFYSALLGGQPIEFEMGPDDTYTMFQLNETMGAALSAVGDQIKPGDIILYFHTDDLDADMARVSELGGQVILPRQDVPGFGALGMFLDPTGNRLAFWQDGDPGQ